MDVTKTDVDSFVKTLEPRLQRIYNDADMVVLDEDTLGDDFQIAANIQFMFWNYVCNRKRLLNGP